MSTRGLVGFYVDGNVKVTYNHYDSYPEGLGADVLKFLQTRLPADFDNLVEQVKALEVIDTNVPPSAEQKAKYEPYADLSVSERSLDDWYCLLRSTQGDLDRTLEVGALAEGQSFAYDSLFCEWGYVINLDTRTLEVYEGFKKDIPTQGLWAGHPTAQEDEEDYKEHVAVAAAQGRDPWRPKVSEYKAIGLIASFPFSDGLPDEATFLKTINAASRYPDDEDED